MFDASEIRESLIAAERCITLAIHQTRDADGEGGAAHGDFQDAILLLRKWRLALEAGVWTGRARATTGRAGIRRVAGGRR